MAADEPKKRLLANTGQDTHGVTTSGINTLLVLAFKRGQANEKKVQDVLAVLSSSIQHFCSSRTFSCCCILLPYILFSSIERKKHQWHKLFFMFTLLINGCAEKTKVTNSFWFLARNYIRSTSIPLCFLFKRNCVRPFSCFPFCSIIAL